MPTTQNLSMESIIWNRLLEPEAKMLSLEAARFLLRLEFPQADKDRMGDLAAKARDGSLTVTEQTEIQGYERVGNLLALMKSKARQRLKKDSRSKGSGR